MSVTLRDGDPRARVDGAGDEVPGWSKGDSAATACWFALTLLARLPFLARSEGALDHDQSVVGLMALDIAAGRRLPIFFDGQSYLGAVESYVAAALTRMLGHAPSTVALAPVLFFGLFVAGQFGVWRLWKDRLTGHLAALLTLFGAPLISVWGFIPRGGYVESLAWALPTLAVYRAVTSPGAAPLAPVRQAIWGFLLAIGYFINPLSQIVYATLALDWTFGRHGDDIRRNRAAAWHWLDRKTAPLIWLVLGLAWVLALAAFCHVDPLRSATGSYYVHCLGFLGEPWGVVLGAAGVAVLLGILAWWTRLLQRLYEALVTFPWFLIGMLTALSPFVAQFVLVHAGVFAPAKALPAWIRAPWKAWPNVRHLACALGFLLGSKPEALESVLTGQGLAVPPRRLPVLSDIAHHLSPLVVVVAAVLLFRVAWSERSRLFTLAALRGAEPSGPVALAMINLTVGLVLYLLQGTSPDASSVRYLVPAWVALPGLLAAGALALPRRWALLAGTCLVIPWGLAQVSVLADMGRECPVRPLAQELARRGVQAVVAAPPQALILANLTHGEVGAVEYQPIWDRIGDRYLGRFAPGTPVVCATDRLFPWAIRGTCAPKQWDLENHLHELARRHPHHVRHVGTVATFDLWEVNLPLREVLAGRADERPPGDGASTVAQRAAR